MSVGMMLIALNVLLEADFRSYWGRMKSNRAFLLILVFFWLHALSLLWSDNIDYGIQDFKAKLPIFVIPTVLCWKPVTKQIHINLILTAFLGSLIFTSIYNVLAYQQVFGSRAYDDIRGLSLFCSHIRYALLISLGAGVSIVAAIRIRKWAIPFVILSLWFVAYTLYSQVITGAITMAGVIAIASISFLSKRSKLLSIGVLVFSVSVVSAIAFWLFSPLDIDPKEYENLDRRTPKGNWYSHTLDLISSETGRPILIYVCEPELEREWNKRSKIPYRGYNVQGDQVNFTLIRYMESKNLRKDGMDFAKLSDKDIRNVEMGCASVNHSGLMARMHSLKDELNNEEDPNGHSLLQRMEYWKGAWTLARTNLFIGLGSGDVQDAFNHYYDRTNSPLLEENRKRAHSQFLTVLLTFGLPGFILFMVLIVYSFKRLTDNRHLIGLFALSIAVLSFFMEDTLETQTGATFFALFFGLYVLRSKRLEQESSQ